MLQSIQFIGSGPPTYVYSNKAVGASGEYYHVFAAETRGYQGSREKKHGNSSLERKELLEEEKDHEEFRVLDSYEKQNLQDVYQKEYGRRESFLWKQR